VHGESAKQIANRVISGEALQPQQRVQGAIATQEAGVREAPGAGQDRYQKGEEGSGRLDLIG